MIARIVSSALNHSVFWAGALELTRSVGELTLASRQPTIAQTNSVAVLRLHAVWNASPQVFTGLAVFRMSDRRRDKRWTANLDAVWDGRSGNFTARVSDLSEGGCYIDSLNQAHVGEVLNLTLQLPDGDSLQLTGEVAHQTPPLGFGLRFVDLTEEQFKKLCSLIEHLERTHEPVSAIMSY